MRVDMKGRHRDIQADMAIERLEAGREVTLTSAILKRVLLKTSGIVFHNGHNYKIAKEHLGVGVYVIKLGRKE